MGYPEFPLHPEPRSFAWSKLEIACIEKYAKACVEADRAQRAAPGAQAFDKLDNAEIYKIWCLSDQAWHQLIGNKPDRNNYFAKNLEKALLARWNAAQPPQQSAQPIGVIRKNTMNGVLVDWHGPVKVGTKLYADTQPVEVQQVTDQELKDLTRRPELYEDYVPGKRWQEGDSDSLCPVAFGRAALALRKGTPPAEVQRVRFSESSLREKARLHVQSGHSYRGHWCSNAEHATQVLELVFRSGFRSAEAAHSIKPANVSETSDTLLPQQTIAAFGDHMG